MFQLRSVLEQHLTLFVKDSHQVTKTKLPDIPDSLLKIPDGANSIYHFSGWLHLPHADPLTSPFNESISSFRHIIHYLQLLYFSM